MSLKHKFLNNGRVRLTDAMCSKCKRNNVVEIKDADGVYHQMELCTPCQYIEEADLKKDRVNGAYDNSKELAEKARQDRQEKIDKKKKKRDRH